MPNQPIASKYILSFGMTEKQFRKFVEWKNSLPELKDIPSDNKVFIFKFIPTGITTNIMVERIDGEKIEIPEDYFV